jgi:hypothetical protein
MSYLIPNDYNRLIQDLTLQQIISGNEVLVQSAENTAITEIISYLIQKYDVGREFTNTQKINPGASYKANDRVYLDAPSYNPASNYLVNQLCLQNGISLGDGITAFPNGLSMTLYRKNLWKIFGIDSGFTSNGYSDPTLVGWDYTVTQVGNGILQPGVDIQILSTGGWQFINGYQIQGGERFTMQFNPQIQPSQSISGVNVGQVYICTFNTSAETFNPAHWSLLGNQYDMFYVTKPFPEFDLNSYYPKGSQIWWKNHNYTSIVPSIIESHESELQFGDLNNIPYPNVFPDDPIRGASKWSDNGVYSAMGTTLTDTSKWTNGDNRNQQMVEVTMDMTIYKLYKRLSPKEIPQGRVDAYSVALGWLKLASKGTEITADLVKIQPSTGQRIRYGGNVKNVNSY